MPTRPAVVIAGGGPVGLVVALMLGRAGIAVTLFDQGDIVHSQPRAATIHPATLDILDDLGAYALIEPQGIVCPIVNYYDGKLLLAAFDHALLKDETRHPWVLQCEQDKLSRTLFAMAKAISNITFRTATEVVGCRERRSEEHTSELQSRQYLVCRLLLEKKKKNILHFLQEKKKKNIN